MTAIEVRGVSRRFGDVQALRDVTLSVPAGQVTGLLGHNGAGKTTLVRVLTGLLRPDTGHVRTLGHDPVADGRALRRRVGVLGESPGLDELSTVRENLQVAGALAGLDAVALAGRVVEVLERLDLMEHVDRRTQGLSAGLRQRVALARAIVHDPELLLLDEPATNMDPVASRGVTALMRSWAHERDRTVVVCTHDLREAAAACDHLVVLQHGTVLATGSPDELALQVPSSPGVSVTVGPEQAAEARAVLTAAGHVVDVVRDVLTVEGVGSDGVPSVVARLVHAGVDIHAVVPSRPTLEDAYVALHVEEVRT